MDVGGCVHASVCSRAGAFVCVCGCARAFVRVCSCARVNNVYTYAADFFLLPAFISTVQASMHPTNKLYESNMDSTRN